MRKETGLSQDKINKATKWSLIAELMAKIVTPLSSMILARILDPAAYGVATTVTIVTSFVNMFTDTGFSSYIVQHEFLSEEEKDHHISVAFWSNLVCSLAAWLIIALFNNQIAILVGNPGRGNVITIACFVLPLTSFSSIQYALFRRELKFKKLFQVRSVTIFIPFLATIPLALVTKNFWALIIGNLVSATTEAVLLTVMSDWKPKWYYNFADLKKMFSYFSWTLLESLGVWLSMWIDMLLISNRLNEYNLGLYRNSVNIINALISFVTAAFLPVMFSVLSRLQSQKEVFQAEFLKFQRMLAYFVFPIGIGLLIYHELATQILLGSKWAEASEIIGIIGIMMFVNIAYTNIVGQTLTSIGKPKFCFYLQIIHLLFLIPACLISISYSFRALIIARSLVRIQATVFYTIALIVVCKFPVKKTLTNTLKPWICTGIMASIGIILKIIISQSMWWELIGILLCVAVYLGCLYLFDKQYILYFLKFIPIHREKNDIEIEK